MDYGIIQWIILGGVPAALGIFGLFSPYMIGERWERIIVEDLKALTDKIGNLKYVVIYRYDKGKLRHKKSTTERVFSSMVIGKKYKALIRRTQILMLKHPGEYTI